jgi:hypothetical protein
MTTPELIALVKKNPIVSACGVLSLALAVGIYFRSDAIPTANKSLDDKSAQAERYRINIANSTQLKEQLDSLKAANKVIENRMLRVKDIGINQQFFYKLETESGVKLLELTQGKLGTKKGSYAPISFTVSLHGDFSQLLKFLRLLEDGTHYSRVVDARCMGDRAGAITMTLNLELLGQP